MLWPISVEQRPGEEQQEKPQDLPRASMPGADSGLEGRAPHRPLFSADLADKSGILKEKLTQN